jgi:hypothetical protein
MRPGVFHAPPGGGGDPLALNPYQEDLVQLTWDYITNETTARRKTLNPFASSVNA